MHRLSNHGGSDAASLSDDLHASVVAGEHGTFDRRHGYEELTLRVLAVNQQRAGDTNRYLRDAENTFNVPRHILRIEGESFCVL